MRDSSNVKLRSIEIRLTNQYNKLKKIIKFGTKRWYSELKILYDSLVSDCVNFHRKSNKAYYVSLFLLTLLV